MAADFPIRLSGRRAWRTYLGGRLIDKLHGAVGADDHFPEEWITSLVAARNAGRENIEEGLSRLEDNPAVTLKEIIEADPAAFLGEVHAAKYGASMGVLVKLIDAAERLTVQVHPDRQSARLLFGSDYGKTECWHILGGRKVDGEKPCVYLGFREGVERRQWKELFDRQDLAGMLACLHRFEVEPGDTILIEGGVPHAIGAGCFLVEIQEPTDYTVRVERTTPSGFRVDDFMCHQGLGFDRMFDCFHYGGLSREETRERWFIPPQRKAVGGADSGGVDSGGVDSGGTATTLIGRDHTDFFAMDMLEVPNRLSVKLSATFSGIYFLEGEGELFASGKTIPIAKGQQLFVPAGTGEMTIVSAAGNPIRAVHFFGPRV